jgi:hypothetical protein
VVLSRVFYGGSRCLLTFYKTVIDHCNKSGKIFPSTAT